ncbi:SLAM family member 5 [Madurella fahalii]|uniref:SLAM family member 5 n=1 Tax=Madurella fahalii TaxID=1157608 RepID=A0ABQ0GTA4_9PEZI
MASMSRRDRVMAVLDAHNEQNIDKILAHHSESCTCEVLPKSLERAPMDNSAYRKMYESIAPTFRNYQMTINDIFEDDKANKVVVWIDATAETDVGPYTNEKMLIFYFDEAGKISRTLEFIDSAAGVAFFTKLQHHVAAKGAESEAKMNAFVEDGKLQKQP